jgi:hypothetical protein
MSPRSIATAVKGRSHARAAEQDELIIEDA